MDLRTGKTYSTKEAALAAGVPESDIAEISGAANREELRQRLDSTEIKFSSGPFKNRTYQRDGRGNLVRTK